MDLLRPGAGAALAALLAVAGNAQGACTALDGTFSVESVEKPDGMARSLTEFAADRERSKLFKREGPAPAPQGFGGQRSDETLLTGDTLAKVTAAAKAKVPGGTIVRVETDADGHAAYEAHMTATDGSQTTVYVDKSFNVVSVETR